MASRLEQHYLHLRYKPSRESFRKCEPCPAFELFDWVVWSPDLTFPCFSTLKPKRVLSLASKRSLTIIWWLRYFLKDITLVVAGEDTNLSQLKPQIERLKPYCKEIYFEAKDVKDAKVTSFSMGFISYYLKRVNQGLIARLHNQLKEGSLHKSGVLASWGGIWKNLDEKLIDRKEATKWVEDTPWIERESLEPDAYWERLAESNFMIAPAGQGIQAPKLAEAWLMQTVPVVTYTPCFQDLLVAGYPLVMVKSWHDVTPELLAEQEEKYLPTIQWREVEHQLTLEHFKTNILKLND